MKIDNITEIGIDKLERLYIKPETIRFTLIYRTATEIHWDNKDLFLYSSKPRDWSYLEWYKHIIKVAEEECNCKLIITKSTKWTNISEELRIQINK